MKIVKKTLSLLKIDDKKELTKSIILTPAIFFTYIVFLLSLWNFSWLFISKNIDPFDILKTYYAAINIYGIIALLLTVFIFIVFYFVEKRIFRRTAALLVIIIALLSFLMRVLDWGVLYWGGIHTDNEFWFHALYLGGTYFFETLEAKILIPLSILLFIIFVVLFLRTKNFFILLKKIPHSHGSGNINKKIFIVNSVYFIALLLLVNILFLAWGSSEKNKKTLFSDIPEYEVITSLIDFSFNPVPARQIVLKKPLIEKLRKYGIKLYSVNSEYPLIKDSIYLDKKNKTGNKPVLYKNPNIIIVSVESFSKFFLELEQHGLKDLTPNFLDFKREAYTFENMYSSVFPTVRGVIAALGSSIYNITKLRGVKYLYRPPIMSKFLLLSDILKERGYKTVYIHGWRGQFAGMEEAFVKRQHFEKFYSLKSRELLNFIKSKAKSNRLWDQDVFGYAVKMLKEKRPGEPFLMCISTMDFHPPYHPHYKHPNAEGNNLLNCLYSTDKAFGVLWNYFKHSPYKDNTLLMVAADHAKFPNKEYADIRRRYENFPRKVCDYIVSMIYFPGNRKWKGRSNYTLSTNLDIAPTILDVMDIDIENPFLGLSIFSERPLYPYPVSSFYLPSESLITEKMKAGNAGYFDGMDLSPNEHRAFNNFINNLTLLRRIWPDNKR